MQPLKVLICSIALLLATMVTPAAAEDYYDCAQFDDRSLCKLLNRYPAVKDLPVFEVSRVLRLYREREDYAEEVLEDRPVVLRGGVAGVEIRKGRVVVSLGEAEGERLLLRLFARHPIGSGGGRIASRGAEELVALLRPGMTTVFQCVGDGVSGGSPVFVDCVFWE